MSGWPSTLSGVALLLILLGLAGFTASRVGSALVPPTADLLERIVVSGVIGIIGWVGIAQVLGLIGVLWLPVVIGSLTIAAACAWRWLPAGTAPRPAKPGAVHWGVVAAVAPFAILAVLAVFSVAPTSYFDDSVRYHIVNAAHFLDSGSIRSLPFSQPADGSSGSPANGALLLLAVMLPFHTDALVGLVDLGCAALLVGLAALFLRELGRSSWVGAGAGLVLVTTWCFFGTQIASAYDDGIGVLGLVIGLLFGLECRRTGRMRWLIVSGLGVGLAMGTKGVDALPALAVAVSVCALGSVWRRPSHLAWYVAATFSLALVWYARNWIVTGDPLYPETFRLGSVILFRGLAAPAAAQAGSPSVIGALLGGSGASPSYWLLAGFANFGLCLVVPFVSAVLAILCHGRARVVFLLATVCALAYLITPFTGGAGQVFGATRYLLPAMTFGVLGLAAMVPAGWLPRAMVAALIVNAILVPVFETAAGLPVAISVAAAAVSVLVMAGWQLRRVVVPRTRSPWFRGAVAAAVVVALVLATANLQPSDAPTPVERALLAAHDADAPVVVMDVLNVTAILGANLEVNVVAAGTGPVGAENPIEDPTQLTRRIEALHPAAVVIGEAGSFDTLPAGWRPPSNWHRLGVEAGAVVYAP
jgi:hypothetical protein